MASHIPEIREVAENQITTVVAEDLEIKGTIRFKTSVMLKGIFDGEIFSEGLLVIGPTAKVTAAINTKTLISHGVITGNVTANEQIVLKSTATHNGDLQSPFIMIENGAVFNGACSMDRTQPSSNTANIPVSTEIDHPQEESAAEEISEPEYGTIEEENKEPADSY